MNPISKKRLSLTMRLQPYEGDVLAEVVDYLNSLPKDEAQRKVADILVAAFLPVARYSSGSFTPEQIRFACWSAQDSLNKHGSYMRFALGVEQPQFVLSQPALPAPVVAVNAPSYKSNVLSEPELEGEATDSIRPASIVQGQASSQELDAIFGGD
ncbi:MULTISPECIES: hypothetical protein [Nostoc]|uniref:Uncharacterized protein n=2 Tax=Nostoc TaxID=1177 RepID=A0ABR8IIQ6_9NOSO|nr:MULTISPECIES: hypothetical protein [Nostoc]MBD2565602.1 hypothetical protein [Nostoc linckia FACHB-391]MBD2651073.1 hypothetical protein [Nostoc foliaceum FACHB-393]